ncbi:insulin-like growth factor-binding protein complex acid labile subunit [Diorhabda carinulata]|uniref:insulin-like growth factor-binding protein complex acid labile subunit n=1 Tax=Diorhabda carinulata TaxID=1163345 RepID=UPI0025A0260B|nr:insulin-like growth factor-binding protein complex acid labile subunit [Diorhabda carinulata]
MLLSWHLISPSLIILWLCSIESLCPEYCLCKQSEKGQRKVSCIRGGMRDPIPITDIDPGMEVLEISAPNDNFNVLSIGPIFQQFKRLEEIIIRRSNIQQIGLHPFWGVPTIRILDLSYNNISSVFDHNFRGLVNLVELHLDNNRIERLPVGAFKHLTELRMLTLRNNLISDLEPRIFLKLVKLHVLKLSGNKFEEELNPEVFKDVPDLRVLELRGCGLKRINAQLYHLLPYLSHLDLGYNQIQFLSEDEFHELHRLHILKLDGNLLPVILEKTFINQQQLRYLCLAKNRLAKITDTAFLNLTNLIELDISYNKMSKLETFALTHVADTLQRLVISGNKFTLALIKLILQTLYKVWHLEMAHMKLSEIPDRFLPDRIRKLNISWNNITSMNIQALPRQIIELDLSFNRIKGLNDSTVIKLETLKYVNFTGNPWSCDLCHITSILFRVNRTNMFRNSICASPPKLVGKKLVNLRFEDVTTCEPDNGSSDKMPAHKLSLLIGLICIIVFAIFSIIFVVCSCVRRHSQNLARQRKRAERPENNIEDSTAAVFCKGEISFKFPLDLTERKMSVSTIDEIKRDSQQSLPNGTATGI